MHASAPFVSAPVKLACLMAVVVPSTRSYPAHAQEVVEPETIEFPSEDSTPITADVYQTSQDPKRPWIVLFHQAGSSRGEYQEIAPKLVKLGFNCLAVDLRSGDRMNGVSNQTAARAKQNGLGVAYTDALQDMRATLKLTKKRYARGKLLALGSSYSAGLILKLAGDHCEGLDAVLAFSPGEYYGKLGKPRDWIRQAASRVRIPVFITSPAGERSRWWKIYEAIPGRDGHQKHHYLPAQGGKHGASVLSMRSATSTATWTAVQSFLTQHGK